MKNLGDEPCKGWDPSRIQRQISSNLFVVFKIVSIKNCCYCVVALHLPALLPILYTNVESTAKTQMYRHFQRRTMVEKPLVSAFQNFLRIENQLNIKKVIGRNMCMCFVSTVST